MRHKIILSTGKEIELTPEEFGELMAKLPRITDDTFEVGK